MLYIGFFLLSMGLTYLIRYYAQRKAIVDIPNERSSHETPTPRGGGLAIVLVFFAGLFLLRDQIEARLFCALLVGITIAIISLIDDIVSLSSRIRLIVHMLSAVGALWCLGGVSKVDLICCSIEGEWLNIIAVLAMVWITNLYNFLDGIDGYAGIEALTIGLGLFIFFQNPLGLVIMAAVMGFLVFNWHKASIFMGDVGSATLGFLFSVFMFYDTTSGNIYIWLVLLSVFWLDATVTLIRRYINHENIAKPHKKHAYQRLVQSGWSHSQVATGALLINGLFLILLYYIEKKWIVSLVNLLVLLLVMKYIDKKKSFI